MKYKKSKTTLVLFILLFIGFGLFQLHMRPGYTSDVMNMDFDRTLGLGAHETPRMEAEYMPENESVKVTIENGGLTETSDFVAITNKSAAEVRNNNNTVRYSFALRYKGKTMKTKYWATRSLYGLGIGNKGIGDFPLEEGESIYILRDGIDSYGDGTKGIENGDEVVFLSSDYGHHVSFYQLKVENNTALNMSPLAQLCRNETVMKENDPELKEDLENKCKRF